MIGPNHSIIRRFTSTGHGAAAWTTTRSELTSYDARTSSGSLSIRTNIVGTICVCVTRCSWIARSAPSASNFSIITSVPPSVWITPPKRSGAAW